MVKINGNKVYGAPHYCGECTFYLSFGLREIGVATSLGFCKLFDKQKGHWESPPKRCAEIFEKALSYPEGEELVIIEKYKG